MAVTEEETCKVLIKTDPPYPEPVWEVGNG
jgi:hypothetical protein